MTRRILVYLIWLVIGFMACLQATCWQGIFYCGHFRGAGTIEKTVRELRELDREHHDYWFIDPNTGKIDADMREVYVNEFASRD